MSDDFSWNDGSIVIKPQRAIAVYANPAGNLIIRQEAYDTTEDDPFIVISREHVAAVIAALQATLARGK